MDAFLDLYREIAALKVQCTTSRAQIAALAAFAAALMKDHPARDLIHTRWSDYLGPALLELGPGLEPEVISLATLVPGWIDHQLNKPPGAL